MPSYVAFLRAINLGATRKFPKDAIRAGVESAGFSDVATYINTGNVRLSTRMRSRARIEARLEQAFLADRGFEVPTIVYAPGELARIAADARDLATPDLERHYVYLLKDDPSPEQVAQVEDRSTESGSAVVRNRAAHLLLGPGYHQGNVDPLGVAKLLGVATNRNARVVTTLAEMWC